MKKEELLVPEEIVISKIYYIRKQKVMLDMDLAILYQVETRSLKQAVKRNILRFPDDFMFQLTKQEWQELITICDKLPQTAKYSPATPFVFSEQGVAMMSSILNSERAIHVNIQIIRIFTKLRLMLTDNTEIRLEVEKIKNKLDNQDKNMEIVFRYLDELLEKQERPLP
ncbi:MAG TPA: ORF6N domain-containing protein, partial [Daejeonella sp.]|nr:ORF6N domain-containing protein [Daejeonella sp.]